MLRSCPRRLRSCARIGLAALQIIGEYVVAVYNQGRPPSGVSVSVASSTTAYGEVPAMGIREGFNKYYCNFGLRGVLHIASHRLFGYPKEIKALPSGICKPIRIRVNSTDIEVYKEVILGEQYGFDLPFSPKIIVDGGANIGMAAIYFANKYPKSKIIAIEAEASNFAVLLRNVRPYPSIVPIHAALWNRDGEIVVRAPEGSNKSGKWGFVTHEGSEGDKVRAVTMQTLMQEVGLSLSSIDLVKLDIEGAEQEVFENTRWLKDVKCLMIELHDRFRSGCTNAVEPAMGAYKRLRRGETTFYVRKDVSNRAKLAVLSSNSAILKLTSA